MRRRCERGAAAIEFALVLPLLMTIFFGTMTLGLALFAQYRLSDATFAASRACAMRATPCTEADAQAIVTSRFGATVRSCTQNLLTVTAPATMLPGGMRAYVVNATCGFIGGPGQSLLPPQLAVINLRASTATPF